MRNIILNSVEGGDIIKYKKCGKYPDSIISIENNKNIKRVFRNKTNYFHYDKEKEELFYVDKNLVRHKYFYSDQLKEKDEFINKIHLKGHFGRDRLFDLVIQKSYGIKRKDCSRVVRSCIICRANKNLNTKTTYKPIIPKYPKERLIADLVNFEKYSNENNGYKYLFVGIDSFSKFAVVYPLKNKSAESIHDCFLKFIYTYGPPFIIHTDNGKEFKNKLVEKLCEKFDIKFFHGRPRHPQSQGQVERLNQTIKNSLSKTIRSEQLFPKWVESVNEIVFYYNSVKHGTTKYTPFDIFLGNVHKFIPNDHKKKLLRI